MLVLDKNLNVIEFNPICEKLFNIEANEILNKPISTIIQDDIFKEVKKNKTDVVFHNVHYPEYEISLLQNIIHIENEDAILAIMTDITAEEKKVEKNL